MKDRPFLVSGILGLGAIAMTLLLTVVGPRLVSPLPDGFITPVLAFEFAETGDEIHQLFAPIGRPEGDTVRRDMDLVNRLDFIYMALYAGLMFTFAMTVARLTEHRFYYLAAAVAVGVLAADILENSQLLSITGHLAEGDFGDQLARLRLFTWLKWGGLALYFFMLIPYFSRTGGWSRAGAFLGAIPLILGVLAYIDRGLLSELFALSVGLMFIFLTIYSLRRAPQPIAAVA
jgi:hypothetical protein